MLPSFIQKNTGKADVLVSGSTYIQTETLDDKTQCSDVSIDESQLLVNQQTTYQLIKIELQVCDSPGSLTNATITTKHTDPDFKGCQGDRAYFETGPGVPLGECVHDSKGYYIYYCKTILE